MVALLPRLVQEVEACPRSGRVGLRTVLIFLSRVHPRYCGIWPDFPSEVTLLEDAVREMIEVLVLRMASSGLFLILFVQSRH